MTSYTMRPPIYFLLFLAFVAIMVWWICAPPQETRIIVANNYSKTLKHEAWEISALTVEVKLDPAINRNMVEVRGVRDAKNHKYEHVILWMHNYWDVPEWEKQLAEARKTGEAARLFPMFDP